MSYLPGDEPATKSDLASLKGELKAEISVLSVRMDGFEERMGRFEDRLDRFEDKFDARMDGFHHALLTQGRTYVVSMVGSTITVAGVVVAITRLL